MNKTLTVKLEMTMDDYNILLNCIFEKIHNLENSNPKNTEIIHEIENLKNIQKYIEIKLLIALHPDISKHKK